MNISLYYRGVAIGETDLGPLTDGRRFGNLSPTTAYDAARPAIQRLTLGALERARNGREMFDALVAGSAALAEEGFEIRDSTGAVVPTRFILVGDYAPAGSDMSFLSLFLPIPVVVVF